MAEKLITLFKRHLIPLCVLTVSLAVTIGVWRSAERSEQREAQQAFVLYARGHAQQLERRMQMDSRFMADLSGLFVGSEHVTYAEFLRYITHVNAMVGSQGSHHLGYLPLVAARDKAAFESEMRATGLADFRIKSAGFRNETAGPAAEYLPFTYLYPLDAKARRNLLGVDIYDAPIRRDAWQKARDWGEVVATDKLHRIFIASDDPSFLLFAPVYKSAGLPRTVADRRAAIRGFVYAAYRADDLLRSTWGNDFSDMFKVQFSEGNAAGPPSPLYASPGQAPKAVACARCFDYAESFNAAGRLWTLRLQSIPGRYFVPKRRMPLALLAAGALTSLLLTVVSSLLNQRRRARRLQQEQDQRFRSLFDQNPDAVYALDLQGHFTAVNAQAEILTGMTAGELLGKSWSILIAPDQLGRSVRRVEATSAGTATYGETAIRHRNGSRIELSTTNLPIVVAGRMVGIFGVAKDITRHKRAEAALQMAHADLQKAHAELEDRVRERTAELRQEVDARKQEVEARKRTEAALRELAGHLQGVREEERARIAREIHDEFGGTLAAIKFDLSMHVRQGDRDFAGATHRNDATVRMVDDAIVALRRIMADLRPSVLDDLGLWATLDWLAHEFEARMGVIALFDFEGDEVEIPPDLATAIFRIVQEALNNVAKHAHAGMVEITASATPEQIRVIVQDNGQGFSETAGRPAKTWGILGMHERAQAFNGHVEISSSGEGTRVCIEFPVIA